MTKTKTTKFPYHGNDSDATFKDPVKDFQRQAVEQRVCLFYVADRVKGILEDSKTDAQLRDQLEEFKDECVHNIGINALIERYEY